MSQHWKRRCFVGRIAPANFLIASLPHTIGKWDAARQRPPAQQPAAADGGGVGPGSTPAPPAHSLAVLPFTNMSGDPKNEYFSGGLSEELLNTLAAVQGLKVAARTSSFLFKGKDASVGDIARKLNVVAVLEGSVRILLPLRATRPPRSTPSGVTWCARSTRSSRRSLYRIRGSSA
jgi:hypothetical protein